MNWLEIIICIISPIASLWMIYFTYKRYNPDFDPWQDRLAWIIGITVLGFFTSVVVGALLPQIKQYTGNIVTIGKAPIVSLENVTSTGGSVDGSAFGFSGKTESVISCHFLIKEDDGMRFITDNTDRIVFHESTDGEIYVVKTAREYKYMFRIEKTGYYDELNHTWHIYIPKDSINRYIKFN